MKFNLQDLLKIEENIEKEKKLESNLKESKKILNKIVNGKDIETEEIEFLHQTIESLWYNEKKVRGSW